MKRCRVTGEGSSNALCHPRMGQVSEEVRHSPKTCPLVEIESFIRMVCLGGERQRADQEGLASLATLIGIDTITFTRLESPEQMALLRHRRGADPKREIRLSFKDGRLTHADAPGNRPSLAEIPWCVAESVPLGTADALYFPAEWAAPRVQCLACTIISTQAAELVRPGDAVRRGIRTEHPDRGSPVPKVGVFVERLVRSNGLLGVGHRDEDDRRALKGGSQWPKDVEDVAKR